MSDLFDEIRRMCYEQTLAHAREVLDSEIAEDIERDYAALNELKAICEALEQKLNTPERVN